MNGGCMCCQKLMATFCVQRYHEGSTENKDDMEYKSGDGKRI